MNWLSTVSKIPADLPSWIPWGAVGLILLIAVGSAYFAYLCLRADRRKPETDSPQERL